jgi:hypothetical protein
MSARLASSPAALARERDYIEFAKESLTHSEPESRIAAAIIQHSYPQDPAQGHDYARYILAEARFELSREQPMNKEQANMNNGNNNRNHNSEQYKRDWAYAVRALEKGDSPEKVIKDMAAFRKDLPDAQKYAQTTVGNAKQHLEVRNELQNVGPTEPQIAYHADPLDEAVKHASHLAEARHLYDNGEDRQTVTEHLHRQHLFPEERAAALASQDESQLFAERDLDYAVRARERGEGDDRIIPKIAEYRQDRVDNPQDYARAILDAADVVRQAEHGQPNHAFTQHQIAMAQQQYRSDLQFAVFQLEHRTSDQVRVDMSERRPEKATERVSFRVHSAYDHSYAAAVTEQAEKIREVTDKGRGLEDTLDVAEREFGRHVHQALNMRDTGQSMHQAVLKHMEQNRSPHLNYAHAVVNQAESIRQYQRQLSIRPEMAHAALEHARPAQERVPAKMAAVLER